jgi:hypothetical protein
MLSSMILIGIMYFHAINLSFGEFNCKAVYKGPVLL